MSTQYVKSPNARLERVGDEVVLLRSDEPLAYTLSDSGAVLWEALEHFNRPEDLATLLLEARPALGPEAVHREVHGFLQSLVAHKLARAEAVRRVRKKPDIMTELVGNELIVLSRSNRKVHLLNESGALLWEALDHFGDSVALRGLLAEAWPGRDATEIEAVVEEFLASLLGLGLVDEIA